MPVMICNQCFNQVRDGFHKKPIPTYKWVKDKEMEIVYQWCECKERVISNG